MKTTTLLQCAFVALVISTGVLAADGNTRAPADTPQDRASDRRQPLEESIADQTGREGKAQGGTAGAYEGRTGGQPRAADPRAGERGSGGAQAGDAGASKGGADNAQGSRSRTEREYP